MSIKQIALLAAVAAATLASGSAHAATTYYFSGQQCQWYDGSAQNLQYSAYGIVNNNSTGTKSAFCPANGYTNSNLVTLDAGTVTYYDGAADASVSCTWEMTNWDGTLYWSPTFSSCSTWGGCNYNSVPGFVGMGQIVHNSPIAQSLYPLNITAQCIVPHNSIIYGYNMTAE